MSWKLGSQEHELKAYDLIGKFYFYQGNVEMAERFHCKMVNHYIENDAHLKKLAISKLSAQKKKKKEIYVDSEEKIYIISSEEEDYEYILLQRYKGQ